MSPGFEAGAAQDVDEPVDPDVQLGPGRRAELVDERRVVGTFGGEGEGVLGHAAAPRKTEDSA